MLDYLNLEPFGNALEVGRPAEFNNGGLPASSAGQKTVGLENVQSRTIQGQLPVPHPWEERNKAASEEVGTPQGSMGGVEGPGAEVDSEVERWIQGMEDSTGTETPGEPEKKDMRVKTQLVHVGVKEFSSRGKDRHFGYIITDSE